MEDSSIIVGKPHAGTRAVETAPPDALPMVLHVPSAPHRPGCTPKFALPASAQRNLPRPTVLAPYQELREHASGLIGVLDASGDVEGCWNPHLTAQQLRSGLEHMLRVRHLDARMI